MPLRRTLVALGVAAATAFGSLAALAGHSGLWRVSDDEVGLLVDHLRGTQRVVQAPGYRLTWPFLQEFHIWSKSPREHVMQGNRYEHAGHVPRLVVRGHEGSSYWFERVVIHYAVEPAGLARLLADVGTDPARLACLVDTLARAVLRSSFGRFSAEEIASAENRRAAIDDAEAALGALLDGHGLQLLQVATTKPRFLEAYEQTIERRQVAEQETERLLKEAERLRAGQAERLDQLRRLKQLEKARLESELSERLEGTRREALTAAERSRIAHDDRLHEGARQRATKLAEADWLVEQATNEAAALAEQADALGRRGHALVRRALAEMLGRATVTLSDSRVPQP